ncbi:WD-repeat protein [Reticulomyxa filosa]|uniref:WD-repeat protein n=1 Tax=Reticulomyxa filosa TaxID=46433 RepID=X6P9N2_RETFI|nr:WD-repeat protein [Reticulomyxa filosa]|eukprot:ETO34861.1 WD-repeat protein [Reticulomyxa filosa]
MNTGKSEETKIGVDPLSLEQQCFDKKWILQLNEREQINDFICLICKQIANNPFEIICPEHDSLDELLIVGEACLAQYLNSNNSCPVQPHDNCRYNKIKTMQKQILNLTVICPRQFQQDAKVSNNGNEEGQASEMVMCNFKGKLKELNDHLESVCPLKFSNCWFKSFGCDHICFKRDLDEHLIGNMKVHFDLVMKAFNSLQQSIQLYQVFFCLCFDYCYLLSNKKEIEQLKKEMQLKEKNDQDNAKLINENASLKQQLLQYQQDVQSSNFYQQTILMELEKLKLEIKTKNDELKVRNDELKKTKEDLQLKEKEIKKMQVRNNNESKNENVYFSALKKYSTIPFDLFHSSQLIKTLTGHSDIVRNIDYLSFNDSQYICSGSADKTVCVWDIKTCKQLKHFKQHPTQVFCVKFSPYHYHNKHCSVICSSSDDTILRFWDFINDKEIQTLDGHTKRITSMQFSSFNDGQYLCSGSFDKTIRLWDVETSTSSHVFNGHTNWIWCVEFSPLQSDNIDMSMTGGSGYTICSGSEDTTIRLWDIETSKELIVFKGHEHAVNSIKYSPYEINNNSGNTICSGSDDETVRLWDIRSGKEIHIFKGHTHDVLCVAYPPLKRSNNNATFDMICSGSSDNTIRFWDVRTNKQFHEIKGEEKDKGIRCIAFLPISNNESRNEIKSYALCYGSMNGPIHVWG